MLNTMIIDARDNVAVAIEPIQKGDPATYLLDGETKTLTAQEDITIYHKLAVRDIPAGTPVIKYGEHIGIASKNIGAGEHVHEHNVASHRENLDA